MGEGEKLSWRLLSRVQQITIGYAKQFGYIKSVSLSAASPARCNNACSCLVNCFRCLQAPGISYSSIGDKISGLEYKYNSIQYGILVDEVWQGLGPAYPPVDVPSQTEPELRTHVPAETQTE